jgi:hypothetical protein
MQKMLVAAGVALAISFPVQATLIGDTITCSATGALVCATPSAVVMDAPATPEFTLNHVVGFPVFTVDVGASSINVRASFLGFSASATGTALDLGSLDDSVGPIIGIANFTTTGTIGIDASDVTFTAHSIHFNMDDSGWDITANASFDLLVASPVVSANEPATLMLLVAPLAIWGVTRRRKRKCFDNEVS